MAQQPSLHLRKLWRLREIVRSLNTKPSGLQTSLISWPMYWMLNLQPFSQRQNIVYPILRCETYFSPCNTAFLRIWCRRETYRFYWVPMCRWRSSHWQRQAFLRLRIRYCRRTPSLLRRTCVNYRYMKITSGLTPSLSTTVDSPESQVPSDCRPSLADASFLRNLIRELSVRMRPSW